MNISSLLKIGHEVKNLTSFYNAMLSVAFVSTGGSAERVDEAHIRATKVMKRKIA